MSRHVIVVDTETTGLNRHTSRAVEVGWMRLDQPHGQGLFVPLHNLDNAEPEALAINGYHERIADQPRDWLYSGTRALHVALRGQTLAGANPSYDADILNHLFADAGLDPAPWHHRLLDVEAYGAGVLGLPLGELPSLSDLCRMLLVKRPGSHTAWGDVLATVECLRRLRAEAEGVPWPADGEAWPDHDPRDVDNR